MRTNGGAVVGTHRRRRFASLAAFAAVAGLVTPLVSAGGPAVQAVTTPIPGALGPIDPETGYPVWYGDATGTRVELCLDDPVLCLFPAPDLTTPPRVPGNFPDEAFWWTAEASMTVNNVDALLVLAQEGAFANDVVAAGDQIAFTRVRIRVTNLIAGRTYTVTHPYGTDLFVAEPVRVGSTIGEINSTVDVGCGVVVPCDFARATGDGTSTFLRWDPTVAPTAPQGFLGDPTVDHTVVGSPTGNNLFRVAGFGLPGGAISTDMFAVSGKEFVPRVGPNLVLDATANTIDFGRAKLDVETVERDVRFRSDGTQDLTITAVTLETTPTEFAIVSDACTGAVLQPGNTCDVRVRFEPRSANPPTVTPADIGPRRDALIIASDDASAGGTSRVGLFGTGVRLSAAEFAAKVGAVDPQHGFPVTYEDEAAFTIGAAANNRLELCLAGDPDLNAAVPAKCLSPAPDPSMPSNVGADAASSNFAEEGFWWSAEASIPEAPGRALLVLALEAAFLNGAPAAGDGQAFGRIRIRLDGLVPDAAYTVTFPYGTRTLIAEADGTIFHTEDVGCMDLPSAAPTPAPGFSGPNRCDFTEAYNSPIMSSLLRWDTGAPPGYLGDHNVPHAVTGSPTGNNLFRVEGPGLGAAAIETSLFAVSGKLAQPLVAEPHDRFTFGSAPGDATVTVVNHSPTAIESISMIVEGPAAADFVVPPDQCPGPLDPEASCEITASFAATAPGLRLADLVLSPVVGGTPGAALFVELAGQGPPFGAAPTAIDFGDAAVGVTSPARTVIVTNASAASLAITRTLAGAEPGDFTFSGCATVGAGASCTLSVRFRPTAAGPRSAVLTLAAAGHSVDVSLSGNGVAPSVAVAPSSLTFPGTPLNVTSASQTVTVTNTGTVAAVVASVSTGSAEFPLVTNSCATIAVGGSCSIAVAFRPVIAGTRTASLAITLSSGAGPAPVGLTGIGLNVDVTPPNIVAGADTARFSPNGDGRLDTMRVTASFSETVTWTFEVRNSANTVVRTITGSASVIPGSSTTPLVTIVWDGRNTAGAVVPNGAYTWRLTARDAALNQASTAAVPVTVDTVAPQVTSLTVSRPDFRPSRGESVTFTLGVSEGATASLEIRNAAGTVVRTLGPASRSTGGTLTYVWNGRNTAGVVVANGSYTARSAAVVDLAGNAASNVRTTTVIVRT